MRTLILQNPEIGCRCIEAAKTVAANENATQEAVDAAARTLQAAAAALVKGWRCHRVECFG